MVEALIPRYFRQETETARHASGFAAGVTDLHLHDGEPLRFKAAVRGLARSQSGRLQGPARRKPEITSLMPMSQSIADLREQAASFNPVEGRALAEGDFAQVSLDGTPKSEEGQPVHMDEVLVEIGGKNTMPEFTENLSGTNVGDERTFDVKYPDDAQDQRLAGKTLTYTVKVQAIKQKSLPELNEEFAKKLGEFATMDDVRKRIREQIDSERTHQAVHEAKDKLIAELVRRNDFEVPDA